MGCDCRNIYTHHYPVASHVVSSVSLSWMNETIPIYGLRENMWSGFFSVSAHRVSIQPHFNIWLPWWFCLFHFCIHNINQIIKFSYSRSSFPLRLTFRFAVKWIAKNIICECKRFSCGSKLPQKHKANRNRKQLFIFFFFFFVFVGELFAIEHSRIHLDLHGKFDLYRRELNICETSFIAIDISVRWTWTECVQKLRCIMGYLCGVLKRWINGNSM